MSYEQTAKDLMSKVDITVGGNRPWDIQVHNPKFYQRALAEADIGLGESYMDGWWDCERIDLLIEKTLAAKLHWKLLKPARAISVLSAIIKGWLINLQSKSRSRKVGEVHYDVGNTLYELMLAKRMMYSCGYWKGLDPTPENLGKAEEQELDLSCRKLQLKKGMTLLDIGCGFGALAKYAAEQYGARVVGITISAEQAKVAAESCRGLPIEIRLQDYRDLKETFDSVVSIGMFTHVGTKNFREYMKVVHKSLNPGGLFLLQTIGRTKIAWHSTHYWLNKYIFSGGIVPNARDIIKSYDGLFTLEDWHNFGLHYTYTARAWKHNFIKAWPQLKDDYDNRFYRMWIFYLGVAAGMFSSNNNGLWEIVFSKNKQEDYQSER